MTVKELIRSKRTYFDGGLGTLLQSKGLKNGEKPELWNITHPDEMVQIHLEYLQVGANFITTNSFGANSLKFDNLQEIIFASVENAKEAIRRFRQNDSFVAFDIGPLGRMLKPMGNLDFEDAIDIFAKSARFAEQAGADLFIIETMNDTYEQKAAVLACKENTSLPVFATNAYDESSRLMTGAEPKAVIAMLEGLGVDALGINCSLGPKQMLGIVKEYAEYSSLPIIVSPNAGMPKKQGNDTVYDINAVEFAGYMKRIATMGATILGGCCGTTPNYIQKTVEATKDLSFAPPAEKQVTFVSSYTHAVEIGKSKVLIGERINPTGKKRFKQALKDNDIDYIINEGIIQQEKGAHILDVNVGLPEINEPEMLSTVVDELQTTLDLPLQIDTSDSAAMERALRRYNGKPMINSVNAKPEVMAKIFPLAKKYGGVIVALTLDESGIPDTAEGRLELAGKILVEASKYGIKPKDIVFDTLCMTISSDINAACLTLDSLKLIKKKLQGKTVLGVSNVSFGLPGRSELNSTFLTMAFTAGLDAAIINPSSTSLMRAYYGFNALASCDKGCSEYIKFTTENPIGEGVSQTENASPKNNDNLSLLTTAIIHGQKNAATSHTKVLLNEISPLEIINEYIVPALDISGKEFESKQMFLPQLLMSAEAAGAAFDIVKTKLDRKEGGKYKIVLATVKGDIHDIGKNIVKVLLQSYGYDVIDLGKDVDEKTIVDAVKANDIRLVGLSALMTTTVDSMESAINALKNACPGVKVMVGGAVLTQEYADSIGASHYAKDAMESVRYAESLL